MSDSFISLTGGIPPLLYANLVNSLVNLVNHKKKKEKKKKSKSKVWGKYDLCSKENNTLFSNESKVTVQTFVMLQKMN